MEERQVNHLEKALAEVMDELACPETLGVESPIERAAIVMRQVHGLTARLAVLEDAVTRSDGLAAERLALLTQAETKLGYALDAAAKGEAGRNLGTAYEECQKELNEANARLAEMEKALRFYSNQNAWTIIYDKNGEGWYALVNEQKEALENPLALAKRALESSPSSAFSRLELAERKAMTWLPIESAPKDGTEILGWRDGCGTFIIRWIAPCDFMTEKEGENFSQTDWEEPDWFYADFIDGGRMSNDGNPTHWMPLPDRSPSF